MTRRSRITCFSKWVPGAWALGLLCSIAACDSAPCKYRGGERSDFTYELPLDMSQESPLCFASERTLELGFWGGDDARLKQELVLRTAFTKAGYKGDTTDTDIGTSIMFFKDGGAISVHIFETRPQSTMLFRSATAIDITVLRPPDKA